MKLAGIPVAFIVILLVTAFLFLKYSLSSSPLLLFSLLNTIILAIMVGSCRPYACEVDEGLLFFCSFDEVGIDTHDDIVDERVGVDTHHDIMEDSDEDDDDDEYYGSDGYEEDEDDNGSDDEIGWEDEEEGCDDNLQKRIEDFIAKAYVRWKEENLRDKLSPG